MNKQEIYDKAKKLSLPDRVDLVNEIWDTILATGEEFELTAETKKELDNRLKGYYTNPDDVKSWEEVKNEIAFI